MKTTMSNACVHLPHVIVVVVVVHTHVQHQDNILMSRPLDASISSLLLYVSNVQIFCSSGIEKTAVSIKMYRKYFSTTTNLNIQIHSLFLKFINYFICYSIILKY